MMVSGCALAISRRGPPISPSRELARTLSDSVRANAREGDIGGPLREIANAHPDTIIGSYPFLDENQKPNTNLVVRSRDPDKLDAAMTAVKDMLAGLNVTR